MSSDCLDPLTLLGVSRETIERLEHLVGLMKKWNPAINLVSNTTLEDAWSRHILDSAQIYALAPQSTRHWADLGSGGGMPGLVIACIAAELDPGMRMTLVESDQRKATFLRQASQQLGLDTQIVAERIEKLVPLRADVLSARALAPLDVLCGFAMRHLGIDGVALFPKGANHAIEIEEARRNWTMTLECVPSKTDRSAVILKVKGLAHV